MTLPVIQILLRRLICMGLEVQIELVVFKSAAWFYIPEDRTALFVVIYRLYHNSECIALDDLINNELERMWEEMVVV
jgi:hypothetical protein